MLKHSKKNQTKESNNFDDLRQLEKIFALMEKYEVTELAWDRGSEKLKITTLHSETNRLSGSNSAFQQTSKTAAMPVESSLATALVDPSSADAASVPQQQAVGTKTITPQSNQKVVVSPFVGTFYRAASPEAAPYVKEGQIVKHGDVLCIIEAMKLMNEIDAEFSGKIVSILVENGQPVEFGEPLFILEI